MNWALARLIAAQICVHGSMAGMRLAAPLLALREGYSVAAVGFLVALFALTQVFLALPAGRFADRHGLKRPMAYSVAVACMGAGLAVVFPTYAVLCVAALMTGAGAGGATIAVQRHAGRAVHDATELKAAAARARAGAALQHGFNLRGQGQQVVQSGVLHRKVGKAVAHGMGGMALLAGPHQDQGWHAVQGFQYVIGTTVVHLLGAHHNVHRLLAQALAGGLHAAGYVHPPAQPCVGEGAHKTLGMGGVAIDEQYRDRHGLPSFHPGKQRGHAAPRQRCRLP